MFLIPLNNSAVLLSQGNDSRHVSRGVVVNMEGEHTHVAQGGTALSNHEWPHQGLTQGGFWELSPHSTHVSLGWRRAPWSYGAPVFVVICRPTSAHLGSELRPSGSLNEFSGGLGVTVQILPGGVFKMTATPCLCGKRHGTRLGSPPKAYIQSHAPSSSAGVPGPCDAQGRN